MIMRICNCKLRCYCYIMIISMQVIYLLKYIQSNDIDNLARLKFILSILCALKHNIMQNKRHVIKHNTVKT